MEPNCLNNYIAEYIVYIICTLFKCSFIFMLFLYTCARCLINIRGELGKVSWLQNDPDLPLQELFILNILCNFLLRNVFQL